MPLDGHKLARALLKKGFAEESGRDHIWYHHKIGAVYTGPATCFSHSKKKTREIGDGLARSIQKQLRLGTKKQLEALANCPMSAEDYVSHLRDTKVIL